MIEPTDIGSDEDLARRVLVKARSIAPIDSLADEARLDAIAILKGVIAEIPPAGSRRVKSRSRNGTAITYADVGSAFTKDDIADLRSLCGLSAVVGLPVGSFPAASGLARVWREDGYS